MGICIASCNEPVLSHLFLAELGIIVFRYVDDFIIFIDSSRENFKSESTDVLNVFRDSPKPLEVTVEWPSNERIRFS